MKKPIFIFILAAVVCFASCMAEAAVTIKKASPVATKKTEATESATSFLPTVIGLVSNVKTLTAQKQQISAECVPTSDELRLVNDLVKEWAKIGDTYAESAYYGLGEFKCTGSYSSYIQDFDSDQACYEVFESDADKKMIWENFPKASSAKKCDVNGKNCKNVTNIYEIFDKITFSDEDYTEEEARKLAAFKEKTQKCTPERQKAAQRELVGGFITQTLGSVGQSTGASGTSAVLEAVTSLGGSGDMKNLGTALLPSVGQMLDK